MCRRAMSGSASRPNAYFVLVQNLKIVPHNPFAAQRGLCIACRFSFRLTGSVMKTSLRILLSIIAGTALLFAAGYVWLIFSLPRKEDFADLVEPRVAQISDTTVLRVNFDGDANKVIQEAFDRLFKVYYRLDGVPKRSPAPLARYEGLAEVQDYSDTAHLKKIPWKGFVAVPVPEGTRLPEDVTFASIEKMDYGAVAEIVHFGSYETEHPTIQKLHSFIKQHGYVISGLHEEVYHKGPGMPLPINPSDYITVIRYQIRKAGK